MSELEGSGEPAKSSTEEKSLKATEGDQEIPVNGNHDVSDKDTEDSKSNNEKQTDKGKSEDIQVKQVNEENMEIDEKRQEKVESDKVEDSEKDDEEKIKLDKEEAEMVNENLEKDENDDEEDSDSDEELPPGLLERPVEILNDKRERKKTTRFTYDDSPAPAEKKKFEVPEGGGIKLSQHPRVEWQLQRNKTEDLKIIHKLFFGTFGDAFTCKKNMRNFSGFPFDKESPEFEKKEDYIGRFTLDNLKWALVVCDVDNKKGKKEDLIDSLLEWCLCPKPSGKEIPAKKKKKEKSQKKKTPRKSVDKNKSNSSITSDDISDDTDQEEANTKKSKPVKKPKTPKSPEKKTPKKRKSTTSGGKIAKIKIGSPRKTDGGDSDDSDAPLKKKTKKPKPPTNPQIRKAVEGILKGADLEVITMKLVCMKVYALYPDFDLSDKKAFIKETVKSIIS